MSSMPISRSEVGRVADYVAALEAALVPETDFVSRRLRERAVKVLGLEGEASTTLKKLLNELYAILIHAGSRKPSVTGSNVGSPGPRPLVEI